MNPRAAFEADLVEVLPQLKNYALGRLRDLTAAEDLVSRTVVKALQGWTTFEPGTNFKGWIYRVLFNEMISEFRRNKNPPLAVDTIADEFLAKPSQQDDLVEQGEVRAVMRKLPVQYRHILVRVCVEGRSYEEVAAELDISVGTVKSRLWRARETVALMMDRQ